MYKKYVYLVGVSISLIILVVLVWILSTSLNRDTDGTIAIQGPVGKVHTRNFLEGSKVSGTIVLIYESEDFNVQYDRVGQYFTLVLNGLNQSDVLLIRTKAETIFLSKLGIAREEACKLDVSVLISNYRSIGIGRQSYPLSFCPGGEVFPK